MRRHIITALLVASFSLGPWLLLQSNDIAERAAEIWLRRQSVPLVRPIRPRSSERHSQESFERLQPRISQPDIPVGNLPQWHGVQPVSLKGDKIDQ